MPRVAALACEWRRAEQERPLPARDPRVSGLAAACQSLPVEPV